MSTYVHESGSAGHLVSLLFLRLYRYTRLFIPLLPLPYNLAAVTDWWLTLSDKAVLAFQN